MVHINDSAVTRKILLAVSLTSLLLLTNAPAMFSQKAKSEPPPFRERLFFGGSFGLQFGTITDIEVSPLAGLWVLPRLAVAVGPKYRFYKDPVDRTSIYGGRAYTQLVVIQDLNNIIPVGLHLGLFLHAEDELLSLQSSFWNNTHVTTDRFTINTVLVGAGISQPMGRRASLNMMALWALNDSLYGLYSSPEIRVTFIF
jgi:hypothetical protein